MFKKDDIIVVNKRSFEAIDIFVEVPLRGPKDPKHKIMTSDVIKHVEELGYKVTDILTPGCVNNESEESRKGIFLLKVIDKNKIVDLIQRAEEDKLTVQEKEEMEKFKPFAESMLDIKVEKKVDEMVSKNITVKSKSVMRRLNAQLEKDTKEEKE